MGRHPLPRGLLLDNPVFPVAVSGPGGIEPDLSETVTIRSLALPERRRAAVQLMAGAALAAEFDLWPSRVGLRKARARRIEGGTQAVFGAFPMPLGIVQSRLGGGGTALEITRNAVLETIAETCGLCIDDLRPSAGLGYFLEGALRQSPLLLDPPIGTIEARCLWAYQWDLPSLPDEGEIVFWKVFDPMLARRIGGAVWADLHRQGRQALLVHGGASICAVGTESVLVMIGQHSEEVLAAVDAWAGSQGRAAVVIGDFPPGWDPPVPSIGCSMPHNRSLAVTGVSLDTALRVAEERDQRFDPWNNADRRALTESASHLFVHRPASPRRTGSRDVDPVHRVLSLRPDGMELKRLSELSGVTDVDLLRRVAEGDVVIAEDRWRLPGVPRLRPDSLHGEIAGDFEQDSPQRHLHIALAGGEIEPLNRWARSGLHDLRSEEVREILGMIEPGALGPEIDALLAESCLAELDLSGARQVIGVLGDGPGRPWKLWADLEDHDDSWSPPDFDLEVLTEQHPRIAAEWAVHSLRGQKALDRTGDFDAKLLLDRAIDRLAGNLANWYSILREAIRQPDALDDPVWVDAVAGDSQPLLRLIAHKRALILTWRGEWTEARGVLRGLVSEVRQPGRLGRVFIDLGNVSTEQSEETACLLRAHRLLEAAGFKHRTRNIVFNLAMVDIERLRLDRAEVRLKACSRDDDPLHLIGQGLLSLARGDLQALNEIIDRLPDGTAEMRVQEGSHMLRGLGELFEGRWQSARKHLEVGGVESLPWINLLDAAEGKAGGVPSVDDPWGVGEAAALVERVRDARNELALKDNGSLTANLALTFALADSVLIGNRWLSATDRDEIATQLSNEGLVGWADQLRGKSHADFEVFSSATARLAGAGSLQSLGESDWDAICGSLGLTGLELRSEPDGKILWRWGCGEANGREGQGTISLIPLGGTPISSGGWSLLERLVETIAPSMMEVEDGYVVDTLGIAGVGEPIDSLRKELRRFAKSRLTVLLAGETGVGKGLAAEAVHTLSGRKGRLVSINAAAITGTLFEAELFGAVKGAFTGADRDRAGLAEEADGGTLFLDEIGDLDLPLQVKLLRFLDSGEVRRVGSGRIRNFDVRVVAASHRDLESMVAEGEFRQDLYYRMGSAKIIVPPLRDRGQDVLVLRDLFEKRILREQDLKAARWSGEADRALLAHDWPGNIRELQQAIEIALIQADGGVVGLEHLPPGIAAKKIADPRLWEESHRELRVELIRSSLERNGGNRSATARELGLSRQTLLYHMKLLGLK